MRLRLTPHIQKLQSIRNDPFGAQQYRVRGDSRFLTGTRMNQSAMEPGGSLRAFLSASSSIYPTPTTGCGLALPVKCPWFLPSRYLTAPLTPAENVLLLSVSTATGCMPVTAGFTGIIPALEYLIGPEENGPLRLSVDSLIVWSIGLSFFGLIFAAVFRERFVIREQLPWPGARAAAHLIDTLHHRHPKSAVAPPRIPSSVTESAEPETDHVDITRERQALLAQPSLDEVGRRVLWTAGRTEPGDGYMGQPGGTAG